MLKKFFLPLRATLARFPSMAFVYGFLALYAVLCLFTALDFYSIPPESTDLHAIGYMVFHIDILLHLAFAFGVGIGKSLLDALRDIRRELIRLQPSPPEEPK